MIKGGVVFFCCWYLEVHRCRCKETKDGEVMCSAVICMRQVDGGRGIQGRGARAGTKGEENEEERESVNRAEDI